jgi:hypothetical protein
MLRLNKTFKNGVNNPYKIGDKVEFFNENKVWIKGIIIDFKITEFVYKAVIKCENKYCRKHYICICSFYLRRI